MKSASRKEKYEYQKGRNDEESNETLESLSCDDRLSLVVQMQLQLESIVTTISIILSVV